MNAAAVFEAWNNPGRFPPYHRMMQARLRRQWPALACALDDLDDGGWEPTADPPPLFDTITPQTPAPSPRITDG